MGLADKSTHLINKLSIDFSLQGNVDVSDTNSWLDSTFLPSVVHLLERVLEDYNGDYERLEKVVINLGSLKLKTAQNLTLDGGTLAGLIINEEEIEKQIREHFEKNLVPVTQLIMPNGSQTNHYDYTEVKNSHKNQVPEVADWIAFLQTGFFPWYIQHTVINKDIYQHFNIDAATQEVKNDYCKIVERIYYSPEAVKRFMHFLNGHKPHLYIHLLKAIVNIPPSNLKIFLHQVALNSHAASNTSILSLSKAILEVLYFFTTAQIKDIVKAKQKSSTLYPLSWAKVCILLIESLPEQNYNSNTTVSPTALINSLEHKVKKTTFARTAESTKPTTLKEQETSLEKHIEFLPGEKETLHSQYCGILLLAPFIPQYLRTLDILEQDKFARPGAQMRAVQLLSYLVTGQCTLFEPDIAVLKILCGMDLVTAVAPRFAVTKKIKQESAQLLAAVIEHWQVLGKTSPRGLQEMFMQRPGALTREGNNWRVILERKTVDILLDKLPWGFQTIKMPWNDFLIHVDWTS